MSLRSEYQKTQAAKDFSAMRGTASFEETIRIALLIHAKKYAPEANDPQAAAANGFRISGAFDFVDTLTSMTMLDQPVKPKSTANLRHDLK